MKNINSENPAEHWNGLDVKGKIVLDLGCGLFGQPIDWNTPRYFLEKNATFVYGIDNDASSFQAITDNIQSIDSNIQSIEEDFVYGFDFELSRETVSSTTALEIIINHYEPHVIKCDIEGAERYFYDLDKEVIKSVEQIAIEYHDPITKAICETKFKEWGYELEYNTLLGHSIDRIGVIYARK